MGIEIGVEFVKAVAERVPGARGVPSREMLVWPRTFVLTSWLSVVLGGPED